MSNEDIKLSNDKVHFTYKSEFTDSISLCQGDVLKVTDEFKNVIEKYHPYFANEQYKYFMVLTQSCDLVRREGLKCKTPYIILAVIKDFSNFLEKYLVVNKYAENVNDLILMDAKRYKNAYQFIERLYNNTEPDYFFLYKEEKLHFTESMVVLLKVSFALKSAEHYQTCLNAKILELSDEFKAKVGWLVGNIYSRVGTTDWDSILNPQQKESLFANELSSHCLIGSKEQITQLKKELNNSSSDLDTYEKALEFIEKIHVETKYEQMINIMEQIINTSSNHISKEDKERLIRTIKSRTTLKSLFGSEK